MPTKVQTIDIHGKQYVTVAERVRVAHEDLEQVSITTEVLTHEPVVIKATVTTPKGTFTGISAANPTKVIEKQSPYEVAETSAVGRALGFAGYGIVEGIATADEMVKAEEKPKFEMQTRGRQIEEEKQASYDLHKKCAPNTPFSILESHSTNNFGRKYKKCNGCGQFIGWYANGEEKLVDKELGF